MEPIIRVLMLKLDISRRKSSLISTIIIVIFSMGVLLFLINTIFSEAGTLIEKANTYISSISENMNDFISEKNIENINMPKEIKGLIYNSFNNLLYRASNYINSVVNYILIILKKLPEIGIYIVITILAAYFIASDKYYIKDQFEYHIPRIWVKKFNTHFRTIIEQLISYIKAEMILVLISFIIILIGLYVLKFIGFDIGFPLIIAIFIGIVDALPILRFWHSPCSMGNSRSVFRKF